MPTVHREGASLHYDRDGRSDAPTVVFVNDVGAGAWLWGWQQPAVAGPYETVVWDLRGTGRSDLPGDSLSVETLSNDLEAILSDLGRREVHLVGAGLGGMVALAYAHRNGRAQSLTLLGTAASGDAVTDRLTDLRASPDDRTALARSLDAAFGVDLTEYPDVLEQIVDWRAAEDGDLPAWDAQAQAVRDFESPPLYEVTVPALVFHGVDDRVVPREAGEALAEDLPRGEFLAVDGGHWAFVESDAAVTDRLLGWLDEQTADER